MLIVDTSKLSNYASELSPSEIYWTYNALDCCITRVVFDEIEPQLDDVSRKTYEFAMAMEAPLLEMMLEGLPVSDARKREVAAVYSKELAELEKRWQYLCTEGLGIPADRTKRKDRSPIAVSPSSPADLQFLFHEVLQIPEMKKRKKGADEATTTTSRAALESFRSYYFAEPFVNYVLAMRDRAKGLGFLRTKTDSDGKFRCSFNVAGTDTGRLSSSFSDMGSGTNLQNVSGKQKDIFVAPPGWCFVDLDLEQGDSRGVGAIAWNFFVEERGEAWAGAYLDACDSGDLHSAVCKMAWTDLPWGEDPAGWKAIAEQTAYRDKTYRDLAKALGHLTNYGGQAAKAAETTKLPVGIVADFQRSYAEAFPCVTAWREETIRQLKITRMLTSPWGRRRFFWSDPNQVSTQNAAIAYSPQNTTGEFINRGILQLWHYRNLHDLPIRFLLQVHDSLVLLVKQDQLSTLIPIIRKQLQATLVLKKGREFSIPNGCKVGWNYGSFHKDNNPYGLAKWTGEETRTPPKHRVHLDSILSAPVKELR